MSIIATVIYYYLQLIARLENISDDKKKSNRRKKISFQGSESERERERKRIERKFSAIPFGENKKYSSSERRKEREEKELIKVRTGFPFIKKLLCATM